jgi:hypothetical protein
MTVVRNETGSDVVVGGLAPAMADEMLIHIAGTFAWNK